MGIDAEILLRVRGQKPTERQIAAWGDALCRAIGAKHFFITNGLPPEEHRKCSDAWHKAFKEHALYPLYNAAYERDRWPNHDATADVERRKYHQQILDDLGPHPDERRRSIELTNYIYPLDDDSGVPVEYRQPGKCWTQDGDPIFAGPDEWFLEVHVWTRYYGVGYERGDLLTLCAIAEWCEVNIQSCVVWYGGDSSGVCAEPWPDEKRRELRRHLYSEQGRAYFNYSSRSGDQPKHPAPCSLCIDDGHFEQYGSGSNYIGVHCASCGKSFESRDGGASWGEKKEAA